MNALAIGMNIKKLREENKMTQQQLAEKLSISYQAVSKWECGTTIPDVVMLPQIAEYFNVSLDELFRDEMTVYQNRAGRLSSLYESDIHNSEIYEKAEKEFVKLFENEALSTRDLFNYAHLHELRHKYHIEIAERYYLKAIELGSKIKDDFYYKIQRQYMYLLSRLSRNNENIKKQKIIFEKEPNNPNHYINLICAYFFAYENDLGYEIALNALKIFPNNALILAFTGDLAKRLRFYDEAIKYWNQAFEIDHEMIDTRYSLVSYYTEQGKNEDAIKVLEQIIEWNNERGFDIENNWVKKEIKKLKEL